MRRRDDPHAANLIKAQWETIRGQLLIRCGGRCEVSGHPLAPNRWAVHHRDSRGMGGSQRASLNVLSNLLVMAEVAHRWTHANPHMATRLGWTLPTSTDVLDSSASAPVTLYSGRRVLLDPLAPAYLPAPGDPYDLGPHPFRHEM